MAGVPSLEHGVPVCCVGPSCQCCLGEVPALVLAGLWYPKAERPSMRTFPNGPSLAFRPERDEEKIKGDLLSFQRLRWPHERLGSWMHVCCVSQDSCGDGGGGDGRWGGLEVVGGMGDGGVMGGGAGMGGVWVVEVGVVWWWGWLWWCGGWCEWVGVGCGRGGVLWGGWRGVRACSSIILQKVLGSDGM